jgi:hypothetical protein
MLASGTMALTTCALPRDVLCHDLTTTGVQVADDVAENSSGVTTSTFITGSSSFRPAFWIAFAEAARDAISKAMTEESTSWYPPSISVTLTSTIGKPIMVPDVMTDFMPFSTPGHVFLRNVTADDLALEHQTGRSHAGSTMNFTRAN